MQPNELYPLLEVHAGELLASDATDEAIAEHCAKLENITENHSLVCTRTLQKELSVETFNAVMDVFESAAETNAFVRRSLPVLNAGGYDFADPETIKLIESLRPLFGDENTNALLSIGIKRTKVFDDPPTAEQVGKAREWFALNDRLTRAVSRMRETLAETVDWDAAVAELEVE